MFKKGLKILIISTILLYLALSKPEGSSIDENNYILKIFRKHDPQQKLYFTKEQYTLVLQDVILQGVQEGGDQTSERESILIKEAIQLFVDTKKVKEAQDPEQFLTYKEVVSDLQGNLFNFFKEDLKDPKYHEVYQMLYSPEEKVVKEDKKVDDL